jgi:N-acetylglutamate synthase-like GNAT family acetyltransferase
MGAKSVIEVAFRAQHKSLPYIISTSPVDIEYDRVHGWLSEQAYWSKGIPKSTLRKGFENSIVFGLYHEKNGQVGVARMITDKSTFAYLADVFIEETSRGQGLANWLLETIFKHPDMQGLRRIMLATADMHPLYRKFGFDHPAEPNKLMERLVSNLYGAEQ